MSPKVTVSTDTPPFPDSASLPPLPPDKSEGFIFKFSFLLGSLIQANHVSWRHLQVSVPLVTRESPFPLKERFNESESLRVFVAHLFKDCPLYINREMFLLKSDIFLIFKIWRWGHRGNSEPEAMGFCTVIKLFCYSTIKLF